MTPAAPVRAAAIASRDATVTATMHLPTPATPPVLATMPAMAPWLLAATGISILNAVMLGALTVVWLRNYRTFQTPMTAGLAAFGALLLTENLVSVYFYVSTRMLYSGEALAQQTVVVLRLLELLAVGFLTYVTMQ